MFAKVSIDIFSFSINYGVDKMKPDVKKYIPYIYIAVFALISGLCIFFINDDYIWYFVDKSDELSAYRVPNGRYFSNMITHFIVEHLVVLKIFYIISLSLMIVLIAKCVDMAINKTSLSIYFTLTFLLLIPSTTYSEVLNWVSGFTNYAFAFIFTLCYIVYSNKVIFNNYVPPILLALFFLPLGFLGSLCVEHLTFYNIAFSVFVILFSLRKKKKVFLYQILFLIGSIIGAFFMFSSSIYSGIYENGDDIGVRNIEFSLTEIYNKIFRTITLYYIKEFWVVNAAIAVIFTILFYKTKNKYKYSSLCLLFCQAFSVYSVFTSAFSDFIPNSGAMRIRAIEFSFSFIYIVSLLYLIYSLMDGDSRIRAFIYLLSTVLVTAPFIVVTPVTARCFFIDYIFWILFTGELTGFLVKNHLNSSCTAFTRFAGLSAAAMIIMISGFNITNKYYNDLRFEYIKEQVDGNSRMIQLMQLPYPEYAIDDFDDGKVFNNLLYNDVSYGKYIFKYYGMDIDSETINYTFISPLDYNTSLGQ